MEDFKQSLTENSYTRQEELVFWDCDREKRMRVAAILSKMAAFAGYDYDARGLTHEMLYDRREGCSCSPVSRCASMIAPMPGTC